MLEADADTFAAQESVVRPPPLLNMKKFVGKDDIADEIDTVKSSAESLHTNADLVPSGTPPNQLSASDQEPLAAVFHTQTDEPETVTVPFPSIQSAVLSYVASAATQSPSTLIAPTVMSTPSARTSFAPAPRRMNAL